MTPFRLALVLCLLIASPTVWTQESKNKSGVAPQVLTLPKGGGAVKGLGETFTPNLNSGTGGYRVPLAIPAGRNDFTPSLALSYSSGKGNAPFGLGWSIGVAAISRRTEKGVPQYNDKKDTFTYNGQELVGVGNGEFRSRYEESFAKVFHRKETGNDFWEVWTRDGERLFFGDEPGSRIENEGRIFTWYLTRRIDANSNEITYTYTADNGANVYLSRIEYAIYAVKFTYEKRPDSYTHYRSGFAVDNGLRCVNIHVGLNIPDERRFDRIRQYELRYRQSRGSQISLLAEIVQYGTDDSALLPPLRLTYSEFAPDGAFHKMSPDRGTPPASLANPNYELMDVNADGLADVLHTSKTNHLYWLNMGDDTWAPAQTVLRAPQAVQLQDDGVLLADMDSDGRSDLLFSQGDSLGYWRSYGNEAWEEFIRFRRMPNFSFQDANVRLMDVNGDGLTDVIHTTNRRYTYWLNLGGEGWAPPVDRAYSAIFKGDSEQGTFFSENVESDARLADMNGDGLLDIVSVHNGNIRYWPHRGYLRFDDMVRMTGTPRLPFQRFQRNRFLVGDINNDGFPDLLYVDLNRVYYWLNLHGNAWSERHELKATPLAQGNTDIRLADMNGNGTRDLVWSAPVRPTDRTNYRYFDFVGADNYPNLLIEIDNSMGLVTKTSYKPVIEDYIEAKRKGHPWVRKLPIAVKVVASVERIDRISHNTVETRYTYADGYYDGRDREFRGFAYAEVRTVGDSSSPPDLKKHHFYIGYSERMGQKEAETARALKGKLKHRAVFGLDGSEVQDKPYEIVEHRWGSVVLDKLASPRVEASSGAKEKFVVFPFLRGTLNSSYERTDSARRTATVYEYDDRYGVVKKRTEYGEVERWKASLPSDPSPEDVRVTMTEYAIKDDETGYIVRPARVLVTDKDGAILSEKENLYDGTTFTGLPLGQIENGNLHRMRQHVLTPEILKAAYEGVDYTRFNDIPLDEWIDAARYAYTPHGALKAFKDAKDTTAVKVQYDRYDLFPVQVTNALDHTVQAQYDYIAGAIKRHTDANHAVTHYRFDKLGLVERVVQPGDSLDYPTLWYTYNLHIYRKQRAEGQPEPSPPYVTTWQRERPPSERSTSTTARRKPPENPTSEPDSYVSRTFFDGMGRTVQIRSETTDGQVLVSGWKEYNTRGNPKARYLPFFTEGFDYIEGQKPSEDTGETDIRVERYYDPLERLTKTVNPNGTHSKVEFQPWRLASYDEEDTDAASEHHQTPKEKVFDAYGQLIKEVEYASRAKGPITTCYRYDLNGNPIEITDATGKETNKRHFAYDLQGRKLYQYEPNTGDRFFFYDRNGNLIYRHDNKGQWIHLEYDALNRLRKKSYLRDDGAQVAVINTYDTGDGKNLLGRLAEVEDLSGSTVYSYDARGRPTRKTRRINGLDPDFVTEYQYDSMDRVIQTTYPDSKGAVVAYEYDKGNNLARIPGFVDEITYNAKGQRLGVQYANGLQTHYSYAPLTFRLQTLTTNGETGDLLHLTYTYDDVGNVLRIEGKRPQADQQEYTYDARYRLIRAERTGASNYEITYGYDKIDNMIRKSNLASGSLDYSLDGRPNTLDRYGDTSLAYDENGNLHRTPKMTLHWDFEDRLTKIEKSDGTVITFVYGADGQRRAKRIRTDNDVREVYYVDKAFEIRDGRQRLYIFGDEKRIAEMNEAGEIAFFHNNHLGSVEFLSDQNGQVLGERYLYTPYGQTLQDPASTPYGFMGKERDDESGLCYYGARYYAPQLGTWLSGDPAGIVDGINIYQFVRSNPLRFTDPTGTDSEGVAYGKTARQLQSDLDNLTNVQKAVGYVGKGPLVIYLTEGSNRILNKKEQKMRDSALKFLETVTSKGPPALFTGLIKMGLDVTVRARLEPQVEAAQRGYTDGYYIGMMAAIWGFGPSETASEFGHRGFVGGYGLQQDVRYALLQSENEGLTHGYRAGLQLFSAAQRKKIRNTLTQRVIEKVKAGESIFNFERASHREYVLEYAMELHEAVEEKAQTKQGRQEVLIMGFPLMPSD